MGVPLRVRRLNTPLALGLVLALAGVASPASHRGAPAPLVASSVSATADDGASEPAASVTPVDPTQAFSALPVYPPAVRIAADAPAVRNAVHVDIADVLLTAYRSAVDGSPASCHLPVSLLAAIGEVESGSLVGRPIDAQHRTSVLGPLLDGHGFAAIPDTDQGKLDASTEWDRAVGPMQFIPATWRTFGVDGDGDGVANPQDVEDASAATAGYLCYGGRDLARPADMRTAILSYNHSDAYLNLVTTYQQRYAGLGLDDSGALTGLPTNISLIATPMPTVDAVRTGSPSPDTRPTGQASSRPPAGTLRGHQPSAPSAPSAGRPTGPTHPGSTPTGRPTADPTGSPTADPTGSPTADPTGSPTADPGGSPTTDPTCPPPGPDTAGTTGAAAPDHAQPAAREPSGDETCPPCGPTADATADATGNSDAASTPDPDQPQTCPAVTEPSPSTAP